MKYDSKYWKGFVGGLKWVVNNLPLHYDVFKEIKKKERWAATKRKEARDMEALLYKAFLRSFQNPKLRELLDHKMAEGLIDGEAIYSEDDMKLIKQILDDEISKAKC